MDYARVLADGVGSWLQFEHACDHSGLFSEKYMSYPIGKILSARHRQRTISEFKHPVLSNLKTGPGRRPEVDFVVCELYPEITLAVESKWCGTTNPSVESVLWDLIRLELLANEGARSFFIMGGKKIKLDQFFSQKDFASKSSRTSLLRIDANFLHKIALVPDANPRVNMIRNLISGFPNSPFPHKILTRRTAPTPLNPKKNRYQVYVWEIFSAERRDVFYPKNSSYYQAGSPPRQRSPFPGRSGKAKVA